MRLYNAAIPFAFACFAGMLGCSSDSSIAPAPTEKPDDQKPVAIAVDYTKGRTMNTRLGKGINLGNAWDANSYWSCGTLNQDDDFTYNVNGETKTITLTPIDKAYFGNLPATRYNFECEDRLDGSWSNPINDGDFKFLKEAGFNSIRLPVRWQHNSNPETHAVSPERLAGVMEDVKLAIDAGLIVVISFHWYYEMMFAANHAKTNPDLYDLELTHFKSIWNEVATAFEVFPDSMLVYDILNEPTMTSVDKLNEVMTAGYNALRAAAPGKTIMFESYHAAKFADLSALQLPQDGNIIYSGHYYEPYEYSHQGHSYPCIGDAAYANTALTDLSKYVKLAKELYPDINGGYIPLNMGEFGISGGKSANSSSCEVPNTTLPTARMKAKWASESIKAAERFGMSWHYWGFTRVGGFESYERSENTWNEGFPAAFGL